MDIPTLFAAVNLCKKDSGGGSSGGGVLVCHVDENNTLDKTWKEINDAGFAVLYKIADNGWNRIYSLGMVGNPVVSVYGVVFYSAMQYGTIQQEYFAFLATSETGYPVLDES